MSLADLAPPGSVLFLIRHELRVGWRRNGLSGGGHQPRGARARRIAGWSVFIFVAALLQFAAFPIARMMMALPSDASLAARTVLSGGIGILWALMVSHALDSGTQAIFLRGDHDLLFSSPLPPRRVFAIRALTIAVNVVTVYAAITLPLVVALICLGQWRFLSIYPVLTALGLSAAAVGMTLCFALFGLIGPRRTRIVAQVLGACVGALIFMITQSDKLFPPEWRASLADWLQSPGSVGGFADPAHVLWWPARALLGEAAPALTIVAVAATGLALVVWCFGERFAHNAVAAAAIFAPMPAFHGRAPGGGAVRVQGPHRTQLIKEWRLLFRDPWLISQSLMQTLYLAPVCFAFAGTGSRASLLAPMTVVLAGNLAAGLVWITLRAEDAPDLIASAPVSAFQSAAARLVAALAPVAAILALPLLALASQSGAAAWAAGGGSAAAALCAVLINFSSSDSGSRKDFAKRHKRSILVSLAETGSHLAWSGAVALLLDGSRWAAAPAVFAMSLVGAVWIFRSPAGR